MSQKINVKTWLIRIKGVARLEHNPAVDASELWNRTATPEALATLAGMALKLASVPDCPYHKQHTKCRYETGNVPNCTECRLQWAYNDKGGNHEKSAHRNYR